MQFFAKKREQNLFALRETLQEYDLIQQKPDHKKCILMLHGFGVSPQIFVDLQRQLEQIGYDSHAPILTGKSWSLNSFAFSKYTTWNQIALDHYDQLIGSYEEVIVLGFSMGGLLAYYLTLQRDIKKCVLLAPYFGLYKAPSIFETCIEKIFRNFNLFFKNKSLDCSKNLDKDDVFTYGYTPTQAVSQLIKLSQVVKRLELSKTSILAIHSKLDHVADFNKSKEFLQLQNQIQFKVLKDSYHYVLHDIEKLVVYEEITHFLQD